MVWIDEGTLRRTPVRHKHQRGYSLIEVLIAIALLGTVLLSITGLFLAGRKNVYSGKQMTQAIAVANEVLEDLSQVDKSQMMSAFVLPSTAGATVPFNGTSYANSFMRTTTNISTSTQNPSIAFLDRWNNMIVTQNRLRNGTVTLILTPTADPVNATAHMDTATILRMRVFVTWNEGMRSRYVVMEGVKVER